jgi:N-acetylglutamate synthase-like GNAT family acetyltransferase
MPMLRPTVPDDVPGILGLISEIFAEYGCVLDAENEDTHLLNPGPHFRERGGEFWVLEERGGIVATVAVALHDDAGELKCLYVHRPFRRRGWGRMLTELTMGYAREAGKRRMIAWSDTRFREAHGLYTRMGFSQHGTRELHDSNNSVEYGFEIPL